jgi:hypothetical protein
MWIFTSVVDANPVIVLGVALAGITCFRSNTATELPATGTAGTMTTPSIAIVAVADEESVLANTMFVTTVVVEVVGTVYNVALVVAADALARAFVNVAISYYLPC